MKKLLALMLLVHPMVAFALPCTDFNGSFESNDHTVLLTIKQVGCDRLSLEYLRDGQNTREDFTLDGVKVKYSEFPEFGLISYVTAKFLSSDVLIEIENHWTNEGKVEKLKRRLHLVLGQGARLLDEYGEYRNDGAFVPKHQTVYFRK